MSHWGRDKVWQSFIYQPVQMSSGSGIQQVVLWFHMRIKGVGYNFSPHSVSTVFTHSRQHLFVYILCYKLQAWDVLQPSVWSNPHLIRHSAQWMKCAWKDLLSWRQLRLFISYRSDSFHITCWLIVTGTQWFSEWRSATCGGPSGTGGGGPGRVRSSFIPLQFSSTPPYNYVRHIMMLQWITCKINNFFTNVT